MTNIQLFKPFELLQDDRDQLERTAEKYEGDYGRIKDQKEYDEVLERIENNRLSFTREAEQLANTLNISFNEACDMADEHLAKYAVEKEEKRKEADRLNGWDC